MDEATRQRPSVRVNYATFFRRHRLSPLVPGRFQVSQTEPKFPRGCTASGCSRHCANAERHEGDVSLLPIFLVRAGSSSASLVALPTPSLGSLFASLLPASLVYSVPGSGTISASYEYVQVPFVVPDTARPSARSLSRATIDWGPLKTCLRKVIGPVRKIRTCSFPILSLHAATTSRAQSLHPRSSFLCDSVQTLECPKKRKPVDQ